MSSWAHSTCVIVQNRLTFRLMKVIVTGELINQRQVIPQVNSIRFYTQGASGVLGTAVWDAFARAGADHTVIGLANSRPGGERKHRKLNLLDSDTVSTFFRETKPNCEYINSINTIASPPRPCFQLPSPRRGTTRIHHLPFALASLS